MKNFLVFALLFMILGVSVNAQSYSASGVKKWRIQGSGSIVENNVIKGYYLFYNIESADRKNRVFQLTILDGDLNEVVSKKLTEPKTTYLLEATYNGGAIMFKFLDSKGEKIVYRTLSNDGTLSPKKSRDLYDKEIYLVGKNGSEISSTTLHAVNDELFCDVSFYNKGKYTYKVKAMDNAGVTKWTYNSPPPSKGLIVGDFLAANGSQVLVTESRKPKLLSNDLTFGVKLIDGGKKLFSTKLENEKYTMVPKNAYFDDVKQEFIIMGDYFDAGKKFNKAEALGLFLKTISSTGKELEEKYLSFKKDIEPLVDPKFRKEVSKHFVHFHNVVRQPNGKILAIGEQYRKQASAGGIAAKVLLGGGSNVALVEIKVGDMIVLELNDNFECEKARIFEKTPSRIKLPEGVGLSSPHLLARYVLYLGGFDYSFTQGNDDNSIVSFGYVNYEKNEDKVGKTLEFTSITYAEDGVPTKDNIELKKKGGRIYLRPGKPGHIMLLEYTRKTKTLDMRLEQINY